MPKTYQPYLYALIAFLAAWQGSNFSLDYRAMLGAVVAAAMGAKTPKKP